MKITEFKRNQACIKNPLIEARNKMTETELKAFYLITSLLEKDDIEFEKYEISVNEFCKKIGLESNRNNNKDHLKKMCRKIIKQQFEIEKDYINGEWELEDIKIFRKFRYYKKAKTNEETLEVTFSADIKPFLLQLQDNFTQFKQVEHILKFESKYAIRIYALLKQRQNIKFKNDFKYRDIDIDALRRMLQLPKSYKTYNDIKRKVLELSINEINAKKCDIIIKTDIEVVEKIGKKIKKVRIYFKERNDKINISEISKVLDRLKGKLKVLENFTLTSKNELFGTDKVTYIEPFIVDYEIIDNDKVRICFDYLKFQQGEQIFERDSAFYHTFSKIKEIKNCIHPKDEKLKKIIDSFIIYNSRN